MSVGGSGKSHVAKSDLLASTVDEARQSQPARGDRSMLVSSARLLLVMEKDPASDALAESLGSHEDVSLLVAHAATRAMLLAHEMQPEVAVVDLLFRGSAGVAVGFELQRQAPHIEIVFCVHDMGAPEAHAALDLGISRLIVTSDLASWLAGSLAPLIEMSRARRRLAAAERALGHPPSPSRTAPPEQLPLPIAEDRYREAYLRACMARANGRREAAKLAGVPYTSLCVMLRKLGIVRPD
jgi:DNA-binding NarL/FixJ family response regulator